MGKVKQMIRKKRLIFMATFILAFTVLLSAIVSVYGFSNLPADPDPALDVLMRETFTDGSMTTGTESVTNPVWKTNNSSPNILANDTNAYNYCRNENYYYVAGDRQWTDYSTSVDLTFPTDTVTTNVNRFSLLVRLLDIEQYGYHSYVVTLKNGNTLSIGHLAWKGSIVTEETLFTSAALNYLANIGTANTLKVDTIDNVITVYWNGTQVLTYTDTGEFNGTVNDIKTTGCVGFYTTQATVQVDNFTVTKLTDEHGEDYDNRIGGNFDLDVPTQINTYAQNGWLY